MKFPLDYPYSPPSIRFLTKVWHPNVYEVSITTIVQIKIVKFKLRTHKSETQAYK